MLVIITAILDPEGISGAIRASVVDARATKAAQLVASDATSSGPANQIA